ncbi:hypothetical protein ACFQUU_06160 [Herbaspirillum sp. GCM10030257]|uniref:hypothetical protein n=1 Tax=Herbaspirillum sp. GCM10030257 TaxID=3273393 RepID=UPI0036153DF1
MEKLKFWEWIGYALFAIAGIAAIILIARAIGDDDTDWPAWVQAVGSIIAIGIAIWIPARQRERELKEKRLQQAELELILAQQVYFLLINLRDELKTIEKYSHMPRRVYRDEVSRVFEDMLQRISAIEAREINWIRTQSLFFARNAIFDTHTSLMEPRLFEHPYSGEEKAVLATRIEAINTEGQRAHRTMAEAEKAIENLK